VSWDGTGRRPIRDKKDENNQLRKLTVGLMKLRETALIEQVDIEPTLKEAILEGRSIVDFRGKRRKERNIVNIMRDADAEDLNLLFDLVENQDEAEGQLEELIEQTFQDLVSGSNEALQEFLEDNPELNMQQTRQLIRNAKKALNTPKTAPKDKLIALIRETIFGETE
jgi:ribosomal 50S subunit-associated protein YjgA (DUF615 family)